MNLSDLFDGVGEFLSPEAGQRRRAWLDEQDDRARDALRYALGPQLYPRVEALGGLAAMFAPGQDVADAQRAGTDLAKWEGTLDAAGDAATFGAAVGSMFLPGGVSSYRQGFDELLDAGVKAHNSGRLNIFAGPMAATADNGALRRAEEMERAGTDADGIWRETGWGRGADGAWRFEIDDSQARLQSVSRGAATNLPAHLNHPALYEAYPQLARVDAARSSDLLGSRGRYTGNLSQPGGEGDILVDASISPEKALETFLHESQHAVQDIEGFAPGTSPGRMKIRPGTPLGDAFMGRLKADPRLRPEQLDALEADFASGDPERFSEAVSRLDAIDPAVEA